VDKSKLNPPEPEKVRQIRRLEKEIGKIKETIEEPLPNNRRKEIYGKSLSK